MPRDRLHLLGIRHHGPGSAASVVAALEALDPAIVLIEGPPDAAEILPLAALPGMRPPLALLIHAEDNPSDSVFDPFAAYSPEWQALRWALARGRPVRFADLSTAHRIALRRQPPPEVPEIDADAGAAAKPIPAPPPRPRDPLALLAAAAGESDGETWWNALVEQHEGSLEVFAAIEAAMTAVRAAIEADCASDPGDRLEEDRREASMRLAIRDALKEHEGPVAFVCGAWHVPALRREVPAARDRDLLRGLPKVKVVATWIAWTDRRLAFGSGYGAGVVSPGWYRHLWAHRGGRDVTAMAGRWQAGVAKLLRAEGIQASTASVIEATRLGLSLGALRGTSHPGLAEMQDATLAVLCSGEPTLLGLVSERLVIGGDVGETDEAVPLMPLQADLGRWQKKLRLKPSALAEEVMLDLRSEAGLMKSTLFNRLALIDVPWAQQVDAGGSRGTFRERWRIEWAPELSVRLVEALRFGSTIEEAAGNAAMHAAEETHAIGIVAGVVERCLDAALPEAATRCIARLQALAVDAGDVTELMRAMPPLATVLRYGTAREIPREALSLLVASLCAEVTSGLLYACRQLDEGGTAAVRAALADFDGAIAILDDAGRREAWHDGLLRLARDAAAMPALRGFAARRCHDVERFPVEDGTGWFTRALSAAVPTKEAADWLEGFLSAGAQLLMHDARFLGLVDGWLRGLDDESFTNLLPALRRSLSGLDATERRRLLGNLRGGRAVATDGELVIDEAAFAAAAPLLRQILGLS